MMKVIKYIYNIICHTMHLEIPEVLNLKIGSNSGFRIIA